MHQKKLALVNDVTGYGRCSIAVALPIVSALKVQGCILPTAILSVHTGFHDYYLDDYTDHMTPYIESWKKNGLTFDGISTGFLGSARQIDIVLDFLHDFKGPQTLAFIDPVMGDNGEVYSSYTPEMCTRMRELCAIADLITPNTTEAAILLGRDPASAPQSEREAEEWMRALYEEYGASVVLTGLDYEPGRVGSGCLENGELTISLHERIDCYYPGTGDVFAAVMLGALLGGAKLRDACVKAGEFVRDTIAYTAQQGTDPNFGVQFEKLLPYLWQK